MSARKVIAASAAALALAVASVPVGNAQVAPSGSGLLPLEGLVGGSLGSAGSDADSLEGLVPQEEICQLPRLGGSVAKFYPLFGIEGIPTGVIDIVTTALDSFPNLLELVAGEGAGASLLAEVGSLNEGLCTSIFGGEMVMPPETVYVDEEGAPVSTVTATVEPWTGSSGSGFGLGDTSGSSPAGQSSEVATSTEGSRAAGDEDAGAAGVLPTAVPVPGR